MLTAAREAGVRRFIAQSYCGWPYARVGGAVKTETDTLDPDPPAELRPTLDAIRYLEQRVTGSSQPGGIVVRYGALYGPGTGMLDRRMVEQIRRRRVPLIGNGEGWSSFVHVGDAAAATVAAVDRGKSGNIYNIVNDDPAPVKEWLPALAGVLGAKPPFHLPAWVARIVAGEHLVSMMTRKPGGLECQGQDGAWLATGSSIMAAGICRDRKTINGRPHRHVSHDVRFARPARGRISTPPAKWQQLSGPPTQFLNGLFTVTRKSRGQRQTTRAEFDCLFSGTRGEAAGAGGAGVGTGRKHEFARIVEC